MQVKSSPIEGRSKYTMRTANHRILPLNLDNLRPLHIVRAIASVLVLVLVGNSVAFAAFKAGDPVKLQQKLTTLGIGSKVRATELDGSSVTGKLAAVRDDGFDLSVKKGGPPLTLAYSQVARVDHQLSTGASVGIVVVCVVGVVAVIAVVVGIHIKNSI
jgi:hypothetical protein